MTLAQRWKRWKQREADKLRPMSGRKRLEYILYYYRFWIIGLALLAGVGFYVSDAVVQSGKEILLQGFFTNDEYNLFPAGEIQRDYSSTQTLTKQQRIVFDDALYIDLGGEASEYTAASNGKLVAYMMTHELDFVVTSDEVIEAYREQLPMQDLRQLFPEDLAQALSDALYVAKGSDGSNIALALDMTGSRFVAGTGADTDPAVQHTYYLFVPKNAPHTEQIIRFIRYCFDL